MTDRSLVWGSLSARRMADEDVFTRSLRGDPAAFSEVYRRYRSRIYGFCLARSLDPEAAAEATQEVFMRFLRADPSAVEHPRAWLFAVARNVSIDQVRKKSRSADLGGEAAEEAVSRMPSAEDTAASVLARDDARNVFLALRRLRPRYRTALILRDVHGQSSADMAEALDMTAGAVDTLVCRARDAFGREYAAVGDFPEECRVAVELIYRERGCGIDDRERAAFESHARACARCRAEWAKAKSDKRMPGLLPFLAPTAGGMLSRTAAGLWQLQYSAAALAEPASSVGLAAKAAIVVVAAASVAVGGIAYDAVRGDSSPSGGGFAPAYAPAGDEGSSFGDPAGSLAEERELRRAAETARGGEGAPGTSGSGNESGASVGGGSGSAAGGEGAPSGPGAGGGSTGAGSGGSAAGPGPATPGSGAGTGAGAGTGGAQDPGGGSGTQGGPGAGEGPGGGGTSPDGSGAGGGFGPGVSP